MAGDLLRRFTQLRRFFRWLSAKYVTVDPFLDLEHPPKPRQETDWLTREEFERLLAAARSPARNRPGLAERDVFVLLTLVVIGLRRAELLALNWGDVDLDRDQPSLLVRAGKGGKPRRQAIPPALASLFAARRAAVGAEVDDPVFCGLVGKRLTSTRLQAIVSRAAARSGIGKHITAHTLRRTAATWLRQETGDLRLVAEYLGHADMSTVCRHAHVAPRELTDAAQAITAHGDLDESLLCLATAAARATVEDAERNEADRPTRRKDGRPHRAVPTKLPRHAVTANQRTSTPAKTL